MIAAVTLHTPWAVVLFALGAAVSVQAAPGAGDASDLRRYAESAERELRGNILPFWLAHTRNPATGGFFGEIDRSMHVRPEVPRGSLLTCRILWTFSKAYRTYHDATYLEMAQYAYRDLTAHFFDREQGGIYWTITADGRRLDAHKQVYGEAFAIYALAEYALATGETAPREQAVAVYRLLEEHARDRAHGGYLDALDRDWRPARHNLLGDAPKTQNSHIHILEAYTNLLRAWPDAGLRINQKELIGIILHQIIDPRTHHLILDQQEDWTPTSDGVSYGHDIELSWLLVEAAEVVGDAALIAEARPVSLAIANATLAEGVDRDGAVLNEGGPHGYTDTFKDWWPQAEAAVGFLNAYQLSREDRYLQASAASWRVIQTWFVDRKYGDWIEKITRDHRPVPRPKVTLWKCPYHSGRSCFEIIERCRSLLGTAGALASADGR